MTWRTDRFTLGFEEPKVMGILNVTPDSFHAASRVSHAKEAALRAAGMVSAGAGMVDIGGQSTRPGAEMAGARVELERILPVIEEVRILLPDIPLSVDTFRAEVARKALDAGADIVNDIGAARLDPDMEDLLAERDAPVILMHMQGTPETMQERPQYGSVLDEVRAFLSERIDTLTSKGVSRIMVDPGFGFGKTLEHNYALLEGLPQIASLGVPTLVGVSRKSMIYKALDCSASDALNGTTALHAWALDRGGHVLRVHDVVEAMECVKLHRRLKAHTQPIHD